VIEKSARTRSRLGGHGIAVAILLLSTFFIFSNAPALNIVHETAAAPDSWTFLAYMSADEPGSPLNWSADINEMEKGLSGDNVTVVALVDPDGIGDSRVYNISHETPASDAIVSPELIFPLGGGEANMGDPDTLIDFAEFGIDGYYDGGKIGIVLWGHGDSWKGLCEDRGDYLTPQELAQAMQSIKGHLGRQVDLAVFDACSMGSAEVLSSLSGLVSYSASSEISVPALGFPYDSVLTRVSSDASSGAGEVGEIFADEYVKFGALMANVTSQAAVVNLAVLGFAADSIEELSNSSRTFIPVAKDRMRSMRNASFETDGLSTIDVRTYLDNLISNESLPRRLARDANEASKAISASITFNRVSISLADSTSISASDLNGITIFMPETTVNLSGYLNTSDLSAAWGELLEEMFSNATYQQPASDVEMTMDDLRFDDGLNDSIAITWNETTQVIRWDFDVLLTGQLGVHSTMTKDDDIPARTAKFLNLDPDIYDLCAYGFEGNGKCRFYSIFEDVTIMKRYQYLISFTEYITDSGTDLEVVNLRTGMTRLFDATGSQMELRFDVPGDYVEQDNILLQLKRDNSTFAWGILVLTGDNAELTLTSRPQPSTTAVFVIVILTAALIGFAAARLLRVGRDR